MGKSKNKVSLIGMVGKDAELKYTQSQTPYVRFSLATSEGGYKKSDGTDVPEMTQWHNITAWRALAEMCGKYVRKGMKIAVDGKIIYGTYEKQGISCTSVEIVADEVVLMQKPRDEQQQPQNSWEERQQGQKVSWQQAAEMCKPIMENPPTSTYNVPPEGANEDLPF